MKKSGDLLELLASGQLSHLNGKGLPTRAQADAGPPGPKEDPKEALLSDVRDVVKEELSKVGGGGANEELLKTLKGIQDAMAAGTVRETVIVEKQVSGGQAISTAEDDGIDDDVLVDIHTKTINKDRHDVEKSVEYSSQDTEADDVLENMLELDSMLGIGKKSSSDGK